MPLRCRNRSRRSLADRFTLRRMNLATTTAENPQATTAARPADAKPPGPRRRWWGLPLLREMKADYLGFTGGLHREHGDITFMRIGPERAYDLFTPELV